MRLSRDQNVGIDASTDDCRSDREEEVGLSRSKLVRGAQWRSGDFQRPAIG